MRHIYSKRFASFVCLVAIIPIYANAEQKVYADLVATGAVTLLKGKNDSYNFFSASPEIRIRLGNSGNGEGYFIGLGTALATNLKKDPNSTPASQPSSISKSNIYTVLGKAWSISDGGPNSNWKVPTNFCFGIGVMNQQISSDKSIYDKGPFLYLGVSVTLAGV